VPGSIFARPLAPAACGLVALALAAIAVIPSLKPAGWSVTALPRVDASTGMGAAARAIDPGFYVVQQDAYDGQFYWGVAIDPLGTGSLHRSFDNPPYRYGHPLYGWLGWLASAGQARAAAAALLAVGLASLLAAAVAAGYLGLARGSSGWEGLFVALNPGLLYSAAHDLGEPLAAALLLGALNGYVRGRRRLMLACLVALPFAKEVLVLVPIVFAAWELLRRRSGLARMLPFVASVLPAAAWWVYARLHLGAWFTSGDSALGAPFVGWKNAFVIAGFRSYDSVWSVSQLGEATIVSLAAVLGLVGLAAVVALRTRGPIDPLYLALGIVVACLAPKATVIMRDAFRNTSLLLVLVPFVIASPPPRPRWPARRGAGSSPAPEPSPT
jgi:hypothetical protein